MYYENHTFPLYSIPQTLQWGKQTIDIIATQLHVSNWNDFVLDIYYKEASTGDTKEDYTELAPIATTYLDRPAYFLPTSESVRHIRCSGESLRDTKVSLSVRPYIYETGLLSNKTSIGEVFIPKVPVGLADDGTDIKRGKATGSYLDRIDFSYKSRKWSIRKLIHSEDSYEIADYLSDISKENKTSRENIVLQTNLGNYPTKDFIEDSLDICALLSIALGTQVAPLLFSIRNDGNLLPFQTQHILPKQQSIWGPLRQGPERHMLSPFIERAQSVFLHTPVWWRNTAHWFSRALMSKDIDTGNLIFALLFDRVYKYCKEQDDNKIHPESGKDTKVTYVQQLAYLRRRFKTSFDIERFKKIRNQIVHEGQPDTDFPANAIAFSEVATAMGTILCKLLGYQGVMHHHPHPRVN